MGTFTSAVIGGSGIVGGYIVQHLVASGERPIALSRKQRSHANIEWVKGDLTKLTSLPPCETIYCTANAIDFASALPRLVTPTLRRVVVFTTTSILTKKNSEIKKERTLIRQFVKAERSIQETCIRAGIGWTILRPTLIYAEGRDRNITRISRTIRKFRIMPLSGTGSGLRQPVHAEDLAMAAIAAAATSRSINKAYILSGGEIVTYREMIGRVFDGLNMPRRMISVPPFLWRVVFTLAKSFYPGFNSAMGTRMVKDMVFDHDAASADFGWRPRDFHPRFVADKPTDRAWARRLN